MFSLFLAHESARRVTILHLGAGVALHLCVTAALAAPLSLTMSQTQQRAIERSRQLSAQDQATAAARSMAGAAGQLPDPVLKAGIDNLPMSGADRYSLNKDFMTMRRISLSQELTRADKLRWRSVRYEREADKTLAERDAALAAIQRDAAIAWLDSYYTRQMAAVAVNMRAQIHLEIEALKAAYRGGRASLADLQAAQLAELALDDRANDIHRRQQVAELILKRWLGDDSDILLQGEPDIDIIRYDGDALDAVLAHHPQVAILERQVAIAEVDANLARANLRSDWTVEIAYQQRGPAYSNMISVGISVPLQWDRKHRQGRELASRLAAVEQARSESEEALRIQVTQTRSKLVEWRAGRDRIARYQEEVLPLTKQRSAAILAAYRGEKATLAMLLAARRDELDARVQMIELQINAARLWAELNFLRPDPSLTAGTATPIKEH